MKLMLVDDQPLFLEGLRNLLMARGLEVVATAQNGMEALAKAREAQPDVILMDIQMPLCSGLEATQLIKAEMPDVKIVMLTVSGDDEDLFEAVKNGASGYLLKNLEAEEFFAFLSDLERGEAPLSRGLAAKIMGELSRQDRSGKAGQAGEEEDDKENLTPRQTEILSLVAQGLTYKEIGARLFLSERTVKYHMGQILERLHLNSRAHAIAYAERTGLTVEDKASKD